MKKRKYKSLSVTLVLCLLLSALTVFSGCKENVIIFDVPSSFGEEPDFENMDIEYSLAESIADGAILHAWSWSFNTIKESLPMIAAAGFSSVQTSPINECYVNESGGKELSGNGKWYYHYQPTDWVIGNYQLGTRDEFKSMCEEADKYGIKIIVDVVPNHVTTYLESVSEKLLHTADGTSSFYHEHGFENITNWGNRLECTSYAMSGLPDVNTENKGFQDYFISFLNDCIACGADGFRYDTAKHIALSDDPKADPSLENNFWKRVTTEITDADRIFNYGEVLQGDNDRIDQYIKEIGAVTASNYGAKIRNAVKSGTLTADSYKDYGVGGSTKLVTWFESHDNYINEGTSSYSDEDIRLGWALLCSRKDTTPLFFDRPYGSTSSNIWGTVNLSGAAGSELYFDKTVMYVNRFRNACVGADEVISNPGGNTSVIMTERTGKGAVLVNLSAGSQNISGNTSLPDGDYTDYINSVSFTVSNGKITGALLPRSAAVITAVELRESDPVQRAYFNDYTRKYKDDTVYAEIVTEDVYSCYYSVNGGAQVPCSMGDKLIIGNSADENGNTAVTLTAYDFYGDKYVMTYYFTKEEKITSGKKVYFNKPSHWGDKLYAYVYSEGSPVRENKSWPGIPMKEEADGRYSYTFNEDWGSALVIFNDGSNQYPAAMAPGFAVIPDYTYSVE